MFGLVEEKSNNSKKYKLGWIDDYMNKNKIKLVPTFIPFFIFYIYCTLDKFLNVIQSQHNILQ